MADDVRALIARLPEKLIIEVGLAVLSENDIDDLSEAATVVAERGGAQAREIQALAESAAGDPKTLRSAVRLLLVEIADTADGEAVVRAAIKDAGAKQFVVTPADLVLLSILIGGALSGYLAFRTGGKISEKKKIVKKYDDEGRLKEVTQDEQTVYLDPQGGLSKLLGKLLGRGGEKAKDQPA
jgi:hypothetical protein